MSKRYRHYFGGFVLVTTVLIVVSILAVWDALTVLSGTGYSGETFVVFAMMGEAAEWIVASVALSILSTVFLLATVVAILRDKSLPRSEGLTALFERLEDKFPVLREFGLKNKVEPTTEDRAARLKERYVEGEISEREFEREMDQLLDDKQPQPRSRPSKTSVKGED